MAIEYGSGGAGFADTIARMRAEATAIAELTAKEGERSAAEERDTEATRENASARTRTAGAVDALVDTIGRSIEALNTETESILANSRAWAANASARGRAIGASETAAGSVAVPGSAGKGARAVANDLPLVTFPRQPRVPAAAGEQAASGDLATVSQRNADALAGQAERQAAVNDLTNQSVGAYAASSQALQRHGALTSEFFQGLVRGEVTLKEFQSQMVVTLGKFSGWAVAGGLVYGAFEAVKNIASGIEATQSGVSQLKRSLGEKVNVPEAEAGFRRVSQETNTPIAKVAEAQFYAARAFPNQKESLDVAGTAVRAEKLDEVPIQDSIKSFGALNVEFGLTAGGIKTIFDELDAGQLKFNARLNQTLPQIGRAAASFANAGGSPTQLVQQIIELNRATGGGGGQGGGNPATFLIREPGNLAKPATEEVLRQFGFDPKKAQTKIGDFNEDVQKRAAEGKLSKKDLQELAIAIGGGTANGLRYGLPLLAAGQSGLAAQVRKEINPKAAKGSAEEDLSNKLNQLNEQGHKAGITLQALGSELGSLGVGPAAEDAAHVINALLTGVEDVVGPLAKAGEIFAELPGPLRLTVEGLLALRAAQTIGGSGPGLAARSFANQAGLTFAGGGARDLTAVQATQRSYVKFLQNEQEKLSNSALVAGSNAKIAGARATSFQAGEAPAIGTEEDAAYQAELAQLLKKEVDTQELQVRAAQAQLEQKDILLRAEEQLSVLTTKRLGVEERLAFASSEGLYAAQIGSPNTLPLLAPNEAAAARQARNVPLPVPAAGAGAAEVGAGSAAVEEESVVAGGAIAAAGTKLGGATLAVRGLASDLPALAGRLGAFVSGLGPLGLAIGAFVGLDALSKLTGASHHFEQGLTALTALESEATSEYNAISKVQEARHRAQSGAGKLELPSSLNPFDVAKAAIHNTGEVAEGVLQVVKHPQQGIESLVKPGSHPGTFSSDQPVREAQDAAKLKARIKAGDFKDLGKAVALPGEALAEYGDEIEQAFAGLNSSQSSGTNEKAAGQVEKKVKLLFDKLKLFGTGGSGVQSLQRLEAAYGAAGNAATGSGDENELDEFSKVGEEITKGITEQVDREVKRGDKFARTTSQRAQVMASAKAKLSEAYKNQAAIPLAKQEEELEQVQKNLTQVQSQLAAKPGGSTESTLKKRQQAYENERNKLKAAIPLHKSANENLKETFEEKEAAYGKEGYSQDLGQLKANSALSQAQAGGDKAKQNSAQLKEYKEELKAAEKELSGTERTDVIKELRAQIIKTEQTTATNALSLLKSKGSYKEAQVGNQQPVQLAQVQLKEAQEQAAFITAHKKDFSIEEAIDAATAVLKAKKALQEAVSQNQEQLSQLDTQIAQAGSQGNAEAQANEAISGANEQIRLAVGAQQRKQGQLALINANNQLQKAFQEKVKEEGELAKSLTNNPIKGAKIEVATDKKLLGLAQGPDEKISAQATLNNAKKAYTSELVSNREREIAFQEEMQQISKQQAIQQLDDLLKIHNLAKQTREELKSKIRNLEKGASNNQVFDLAPGSIKLPTAYDVHRAAGEALARSQSLVPQGGAPVSVVRQTNQITVNVANASDVPKVGEELERITGGHLSTRLRKAGIRGT